MGEGMKERPILFSGEMVRAILEGRKTQTRRLIKLPVTKHTTEPRVWMGPRKVGVWITWDDESPSLMTAIKCQHGVPGDRLWVRETHAFGESIMSDGHRCVIYKATSAAASDVAIRWRPSIFMPRWASRITLEIVSVRVERLQEITEDDVVAEGIEFPCEEPETSEHPVGCVCEYRNLWDRINGNKHPWSSNPWVWRIEFKRRDL